MDQRFVTVFSIVIYGLYLNFKIFFLVILQGTFIGNVALFLAGHFDYHFHCQTTQFQMHPLILYQRYPMRMWFCSMIDMHHYQAFLWFGTWRWGELSMIFLYFFTEADILVCHIFNQFYITFIYSIIWMSVIKCSIGQLPSLACDEYFTYSVKNSHL